MEVNKKPHLEVPSSVGDGWTAIPFRRLALKELRETLRDRRTIITLLLMPLLVYPILSLLFQSFLFSSLKGPSSDVMADQFLVIFDSERDLIEITDYLKTTYRSRKRFEADERSEENSEEETKKQPSNLDLELPHYFSIKEEMGEGTLEEIMKSNLADLAIRVVRTTAKSGFTTHTHFELIHRDDSPRSLRALRFVTELISWRNQQELGSRLQAQQRAKIATKSYSRKNISESSIRTSISIAALVPLILTLMTITGAIYPAIDLTAGERERGTLESLVAAPIPRIRILAAKLCAIVTVALLTAILNLVGMMSTIWVFQLETALFGEQGITLLVVAQILGLLLLFAAFFSSVLLVITSFARSFKEGQAYLIPIMLLALAPGMLSLNPDMKLTKFWALTPLVNIVLLSRDVLQGEALWTRAGVTIAATIFYALVALTLAARFFGTAAVLYGDSKGGIDFLRRPKTKRSRAEASLAMLCLALLFPASFLWQGVMGRVYASDEIKFAEKLRESYGDSIKLPANDESNAENTARWQQIEEFREGQIIKQIVIAATGIVVVFFVIPWLLTWFYRVQFFRGFQVRLPSFLSILAGILLGIGLGPLLIQGIASSAQWIDFVTNSAEETPANSRTAAGTSGGTSDEEDTDSQTKETSAQAEDSEQQKSSKLVSHAEAYTGRLKKVDLWIVLLCFAIIPAIFEELFFRGLLFRALLRNLSPLYTIVGTGILFGVFHLISSSGIGLSRFAPTALMGVILGWVCYRSRSVIPGMILHAIHNSLALSIAMHRDVLAQNGWIKPDQTYVPVWILVIGLVLCVIGTVLLRKKQSPL